MPADFAGHVDAVRSAAVLGRIGSIPFRFEAGRLDRTHESNAKVPHTVILLNIALNWIFKKPSLPPPARSQVTMKPSTPLCVASLVSFAALAHAEPASEGFAVEPTSISLATTSPDAETAAQRDARLAWWRDAKFGLFIHWGVYAVPAGRYGENISYGEWIMQSARIPVAAYRDFAKQFNPVKYDPTKWTRIAQDAGMRYIVITAKHHDGFAMFPSKASNWNIVEASPHAKDVLGPLVDSAKSRGIKIGFYYSQSQDWVNPGGAKQHLNEGEGWDESHKGSFDQYLESIAVPQVKEILSTYPIDILWWDTPIHMTRERAAPLADLLTLRPGIITNNRLGGGFRGDTSTPEQFIPATGFPGDWETCMTLNNHWGYNASDQDWKSSTELIRKLARICSKGGNFLLNVGPTAEGAFPPICVERLKDIGAWLRINGESIYGTTAGPFHFLYWGCATRKGDKLFLHVFEWPKDGKLRVPLSGRIKRAYLLAMSDEPLKCSTTDSHLTIIVPTAAPDAHDSVVVLEIDGEPQIAPLASAGATVVATDTLDGTAAGNILSDDRAKPWRANKNVKRASVELALTASMSIGAFGLDEPDVWPRLIQHYKLEVRQGGEWNLIAEGDTNGHGVTAQTNVVTGQVFRLTMSCEAGSPGIGKLQLYAAD